MPSKWIRWTAFAALVFISAFSYTNCAAGGGGGSPAAPAGSGPTGSGSGAVVTIESRKLIANLVAGNYNGSCLIFPAATTTSAFTVNVSDSNAVGAGTTVDFLSLNTLLKFHRIYDSKGDSMVFGAVENATGISRQFGLYQYLEPGTNNKMIIGSTDTKSTVFTGIDCNGYSVANLSSIDFIAATFKSIETAPSGIDINCTEINATTGAKVGKQKFKALANIISIGSRSLDLNSPRAEAFVAVSDHSSDLTIFLSFKDGSTFSLAMKGVGVPRTLQISAGDTTLMCTN